MHPIPTPFPSPLPFRKPSQIINTTCIWVNLRECSGNIFVVFTGVGYNLQNSKIKIYYFSDGWCRKVVVVLAGKGVGRVLRLSFEHPWGEGIEQNSKNKQGGREINFWAFCDNLIIECPLSLIALFLFLIQKGIFTSLIMLFLSSYSSSNYSSFLSVFSFLGLQELSLPPKFCLDVLFEHFAISVILSLH